MFLSDSQLEALLEREPNVLEGLDPGAGPRRKDSPIQPASVDLTIGAIYIPGVKRNDLGSTANPVSQHNLDSGKTALVTTRERCNFPADLGAIGFPPSRVSSQGLLMTNPGHVDPGYSGRMRFTVINMAQKPYPLRHGDRIVTLLLFRLEQAAASGWTERNSAEDGPPNTGVHEELLARLSPDFLDVSERAKQAASGEERKTRTLGVLVPLAGAVLLAFVAWYTSIAPINDDIKELERDTARLEAIDDQNRLEQRVTAIERQLPNRTAAGK